MTKTVHKDYKKQDIKKEKQMKETIQKIANTVFKKTNKKQHKTI